MKKSTIYLLLLLTPIFIVLTNPWAFLHEFGHSTTAWLLGFKSNPWDIIYGGWSWNNIIFLENIDENVNYYFIYLLGHKHWISLISFDGPAVTAVIYVITYFLVTYKKIKNPYFLYYVFWINVMSLMEVFAYVPLRTFTTHGDIGHVEFGLNLSPWWIILIFGSLVLLAYWKFYTKTLPSVCQQLQMDTWLPKIILLIFATFVLLVYSSMRMFFAHYGEISYILAIASCVLAPAVVVWRGVTLHPVAKIN